MKNNKQKVYEAAIKKLIKENAELVEASKKKPPVPITPKLISQFEAQLTKSRAAYPQFVTKVEGIMGSVIQTLATRPGTDRGYIYTNKVSDNFRDVELVYQSLYGAGVALDTIKKTATASGMADPTLIKQVRSAIYTSNQAMRKA